MTPEISITTAYHNRKPHFLKTLEVLEANPEKNFEIVVVDDGSDKEHRLEDIVNNFSFDINLIRINPEDKKHINPCIPFNIAFRNARAEKIIIQNPECVHIGNVLQFVDKTLSKNEYHTFCCWAADEHESRRIIEHPLKNLDSHIKNVINKYGPNPCNVIGDSNGWYNHPEVRPACFHFTSCIAKEDLYDLGGFDERYSSGVGYDDNELLLRIMRKGMKISIIRQPLVIHLWHGVGNYTDKMDKYELNKSVFENFTKKEKDWRVNCL